MKRKVTIEAAKDQCYKALCNASTHQCNRKKMNRSAILRATLGTIFIYQPRSLLGKALLRKSFGIYYNWPPDNSSEHFMKPQPKRYLDCDLLDLKNTLVIIKRLSVSRRIHQP